MDLIGIDIILGLTVVLFVAVFIFFVGGMVFFLLSAGILWNKTSRWIPCVFAAEAILLFLFFLGYTPWKLVLKNSANATSLLPMISVFHILLALLVHQPT